METSYIVILVIFIVLFIQHRNEKVWIKNHILKKSSDRNVYSVTEMFIQTGFGRHSYEVVGKMHEPEGSRHENAADRLRELNSLYTQALITKEEYDQKKKEILDEL